ncbi:hypothetical protein [Telluria aromaticivorans]|uniref:hypothetical protein n=1 Tax=Telluria aromaticivorans TaxID=2725995 RepID=UPI001BB1E689|nr:hypothetical protein [Telluria aromaticivorans]
MRQSSRSVLQTTIVLAGILSAIPASAATLSVGTGKTYATPCKAFAVAKEGDLVEIQGNQTYTGDVCGIYANKLTIRGVNGRPKINANGMNALGKGTWVVSGQNITIDNVEMFGAKVPDRNGAALRLEGTNFTLRNAFLHDNENGILTGANTASNILIEYSEFGHNGNGTGQTHNLYIGNVGSLTFRYNFSHDAVIGHNLKSRARVNTIVYSRFSSTAPGQTGTTATGRPSYEIDLPNAGTSYIIGNVIQQPAAHDNPNLVAYGAEGASNPGHDLYVVNNTFLNDDSSRGNFVMVGSGVTKKILLQNNIFAGIGTLTNQVGAIEKTNYRATAPGFVNRAAYDLRPTASALVINAGSAPGNATSGFSLAAVAQYKHSASGETRPVSGLLDIGAYEAAAVTTLPTPTPAPTPSPAPAPTPAPAPAPAPAPTPTGWTTCAAEWSTCSFTGTRQVRYGTATKYVTKTLTGPTICTNTVFGDPAPGSVKSCSYGNTTVTPTTTTPAPAPAPAPAPVPSPTPTTATWTHCAGEFGTCVVPGTREVRYGVAGSFATKIVTGSVACSNAVFGDPKLGMTKSCSYSSLVR